MENREEIIRQTVQRLQAIKTLEEYKASKEMILDMVEVVFKSSLKTLKDFFEDIFSMEPKEKQKKVAEFQDPGFMFDPEIGKEMERLDSIPGALEYSETFMPEMEKRIKPYIEEITQQMGKLMETSMGELAGEMAQGMAQEFGGELEEKPKEEPVEDLKKEPEDDSPKYIPFNPFNPDTPDTLFTLIETRTLDDLNVYNNVQRIEMGLGHDIKYLETLTDANTGGVKAEDLSKIEKLRHDFNRIVPEMDKQFERLAYPDAQETALKIKKEILDKVGPTLSKMQEYLDKVDVLAKELN